MVHSCGVPNLEFLKLAYGLKGTPGLKMCEVTTKNFKVILPQLKEVLKAAKFISLDTEFSCLTASRKFENR